MSLTTRLCWCLCSMKIGNWLKNWRCSCLAYCLGIQQGCFLLKGVKIQWKEFCSWVSVVMDVDMSSAELGIEDYKSIYIIRIKSGEPGFLGFSVPEWLSGVICKPEGAAWGLVKTPPSLRARKIQESTIDRLYFISKMPKTLINCI